MADPRFFKNHGPFTLARVIEESGAEAPLSLNQADGATFEGVGILSLATPAQITHFHNVKYKKVLSETKAGACFITADYVQDLPQGCIPLVTQTPYRAYAKIAQLFYPESTHIRPLDSLSDQRIHATAKISSSAQISYGATIGAGAEIGDHVYIGENSSIGAGVVIGAASQIASNVSISHSILGKGVLIHTGARIGQAGFGFDMDKSGPINVPQLGRVIIEDGVEIGANTTIDRGSGPDTVIGAGSRLDNLIQIAHNVQLGKGCIVVAQVGISGSTHIGDFTAIGGQAGITGHLKIGRGVQIAAQSGVMRDIEDGQVVGGSPAVQARQWHRQTIALERLCKSK